MKRLSHDNVLHITMIVIFVLAIIVGFWYAKFQFDLCYPKVSSDFWYCLQHAAG